MNRSDHHRLLQVPREADERDIKRAYARLLKKTRPDDDAAAFQQLQEAYEYCLGWARRRALSAERPPAEPIARDVAEYPVLPRQESDQAGPATQETHPPAPRTAPSETEEDRAPADASPMAPHTRPLRDDRPERSSATGSSSYAPQPRAFDVQAFVEQLYGLLDAWDPRPLRDWLYAQEALYSVDLKQALRPVVIRALHDAPSLGDARVVSTLLEFFGLDKLDREGLAANAQSVLEHRERHEQVGRVLRRLELSERDLVARMAAREFRGKKNWLRRFLLLMLPTAPSRLAGYVAGIRQIQPRLQHEALDAPSMAFWEHATDVRRLGRPRVVTAILRTVIWLGLFFGFLALFARSPDDRMSVLHAYLAWTAGVTGAWFAWALARMGWMRAVEWSARRWRLTPGMLLGASATIAGLILSWIPVAGPLPAGIGLLIGYIRPSLGRGRLRMVMAFLGPLVMWGCAQALLEPQVALLGPYRTTALAATLAALPLIVQYGADRRAPPPRWGKWVVPFATALFVFAVQAVPLLRT